MIELIYSQEYEEAVIGGLIVDTYACSEVFEIISKDNFYTELKDVFSTIQRMWEDNISISLITVSEATGRPSSFLSQLTNNYTTPTAVINYA